MSTCVYGRNQENLENAVKVLKQALEVQEHRAVPAAQSGSNI